MQTLNDQDFSSVVNQAVGPILVKFGAPWCAPCCQLDSTLSAIEAEKPEKRLPFYSLDIAASPATSRACQVMSVPTLVVFEQGQAIKVLRGPRTRTQLLQDLSDYLGPLTIVQSAI